MYSEEDGGSAGYLAEPGLSHKDWLSGFEFSLPGPQKYVKKGVYGCSYEFRASIFPTFGV